jgi:hypothetical protein
MVNGGAGGTSIYGGAGRVTSHARSLLMYGINFNVYMCGNLESHKL